MPGDGSRLVYSTDGGRLPATRTPSSRASKPVAAAAVPDDGFVRLHRGKPGKGGKPLTVITGLPGSESDLDALLRQIKQAIGTGGSREGRVLSIQGDHRDVLRVRLEALGHRVKLAGG